GSRGPGVGGRRPAPAAARSSGSVTSTESHTSGTSEPAGTLTTLTISDRGTVNDPFETETRTRSPSGVRLATRRSLPPRIVTYSSDPGRSGAPPLSAL